MHGHNPLLDALGQAMGHLTDNLGQLAGRTASGLGAFGGSGGRASSGASCSSSSSFSPSGAGAGATAIGRAHYQQHDDQRPRARVLSPGCWVPPVASISGSAFGAGGAGTSGGSGLGAALGALWNNPLTSGGNGNGGTGADAAPRTAPSTTTTPAMAAQPMYQLGMAREEVKARLAPIPVYTVANPKNEFVLVAGENNTQLGFFFFRKEDAEAIVEKIREENPRLARDSKVLRVTMDNVFDVFTTPRDQTGLSGIHFRFMPDASQVRRALRLHKEAGLPTEAFVGVPVFQAEGLTVTAADAQYVPLFLAGEDLEAAVGAAHRARHAPQIAALRDRAAAAQAEYEAAARAAEAAAIAAGGGKSNSAARSAQNKAAKAQAKAEAARAKATEAEAAPAPKVEVGSLEEVIARMAASEGGELAAWSQVMIVAPGLLLKQQQEQREQAAAAAAGGGAGAAAAAK